MIGGAHVPDEDVGKYLYATYCESSDNKNYRGDPCPEWEELPEGIRKHWTMVAKAARRHFAFRLA